MDDNEEFGAPSRYWESTPVVEIRAPIRPRKCWLLSHLLLSWVDPLVWLGWKKTLSHDDLYIPPPETDSKSLLEQFNKYWLIEVSKKNGGGKANVWIVIFKCYWFSFIIIGVMLLLEVLLLVGQSLILGYIASYFTIVSPTSDDTSRVYLLSVGLILMGVFILVIHSHAFLLAQKVGMMCRVMCTSAIYQKVLRLSQETLSKLSTGHVINLTSNDVQRFEKLFSDIHFLWISPFHIIIFAVIVYRELGWPSFPATGLVILLVPLQLLLAFVFGKLWLKSAVLTDHRVRVMNEIIAGIRVIKMYAWEYAFRDLVTHLRKVEVTQILKYSALRATGMAFSDVISLSVVVFIIVILSLIAGEELSLFLAVFILSMSKQLVDSTVYYVTRAAILLFDANTSVKRIQTFLELEELKTNVYINNPRTANPRQTSCSLCAANPTPVVVVDDVSLSWNQRSTQSTLSGVSFSLNREKPLLAVVGPVGAGKSTLLQGLLGELEPVKGRLDVKGTISYCSQEPWVFSGTLKENILFGMMYDPVRYHTVLKSCALDEDVDHLLHRDLTLVGERGVSLSGGQKARVNLARAIYRQSDLYLLDDPLSAVDTAVSRQLYDRVIRGLLRESCVVLVTHQLQFAQLADYILAIKKGNVEAYGTPGEIYARGVELSEFLSKEIQNCDDSSISRMPSKGHVDVDDILHNSYCNSLSVQSSPSVQSLYSEEISNAMMNDPPPEEKGHGTVSFKTYYYYFRAGANYCVLATVLIIFLLGEGNIVIFDWWLTDWADCASRNISIETQFNNGTTQPPLCELNTKERVGIYGGLLTCLIMMNITKFLSFFFLCVNASRVLHNHMFGSVLRAAVHFFDTNPVGRILNRFSNDTGYLDDLLPSVFAEYLLLLVKFVATMLTACIANPWMFIPAIFISVFLLIMRVYYLKTSREIKRLEAIARSPIFSHISSTLQGLPTIRSFHEQSTALDSLLKFQNEHSRAFYLYVATGRWFGLRIDSISNVFLALLVFSSIPLAGTLDPGLVGLSLSYAVTLAVSFQFCVRFSAEVENLMISGERIMEYGQLNSEASLETNSPQKPPPSNWPNQGAVSFCNVNFSYSPDLPFVLKDLSFSISPGEKVGIVGRTGAGKSSIVSAIFQLAEPLGHILIDDVDIGEIGLHDIRQHISIIPQDPVLFSGTIRYNLDPFQYYNDSQLWTALTQVQLESVINKMDEGLGMILAEGGSNFSVGQKQLLCLARALLRKSKILILDEATANVDLKTDAIIQEVLREQFVDCTVLTVAHRLNTIMDYDRVLVMSDGMVEEFDTPSQLLQQPDTLFKQMVHKTGKEMSRKLYKMASDSNIQRIFRETTV